MNSKGVQSARRSEARGNTRAMAWGEARRRLLCGILSVSFLLLFCATGLTAQSSPSFLELAHRLPRVTKVLMMGAHPDDENSALLVDLSIGESLHCAYLSATRGEGGQNLIGPELFDALGIIRTEELLASRRYDHCEQFFTRAYDFGFSKDPQEAFQKWGREEVLGDMVRVIRRYRPDVVISVWTGTPADGHGHHQAVGILTPEAVRAAGDPLRFPEQIRQGLRAWSVRRLYVLSRKDDANSFSVDLGQYSPVLDLSLPEIAARGRDQHQTQGQGTIDYWGPLPAHLTLLEIGGASDLPKPGVPAQTDYQEVLRTGMSDWIRFVAGDERQLPTLPSALAAIQSRAEEIARSANDQNPEDSVPDLVKGIGEIRTLRQKILESGLKSSSQAELADRLRSKEEDFVETLNAALGLNLDARSVEVGIVSGEKGTVVATLMNRSNVSLQLKSISLEVRPGWVIGKLSGEEKLLGFNASAPWKFSVMPSSETPVTEMYWLRQPRRGDHYEVADPTLIGRAENRPNLRATATYELPAVASGVEFQILSDVEYAHVDPRYGERREAFRVLPAVSVTTSPSSLIIPVSPRPVTRNVFVRIENEKSGQVGGTVKLLLPRGWSCIPSAVAISAGQEGDVISKKFVVRIPAGTAQGDYPVDAVATLGEQNFSRGFQTIDYPHIRAQVIYHPARTIARVMDLKVFPGLKVGYVMGTGDRVPESLEQMGVHVTMLDEQALATADLAPFDAIVTGIRAYDVRRDLAQSNPRLLDYVRSGGTLIVQYNSTSFGLKPALLTGARSRSAQSVAQSTMDPELQREWTETNGPQPEEKLLKFADMSRQFGPYPMLRGQLTDRVVDETAPVKILAPNNRIFREPNLITEKDFEGWVQERGLYFMKAWDSRYISLLSSHDPGERELPGGMLYAKFGRGNYVMTDYAWFRQLPAGVSGAYRIFANLLSLSTAPRSSVR